MATHKRERWVTFDCFGTLVDWRSGFSALLTPIAGGKIDALLHAYHRFEPLVEAERPHRSYKDVLKRSLLRAVQEVGIRLSDDQACILSHKWSSLPVFGDVEEALMGLREAGYKPGVLTNCDDDLFALTQRSFHLPFDLVITAEQVRDYKPSLAHFQEFSRLTEVALDDWVHVACSWFHDIAPARELGIKRIWLDRDRSGDDPTAASLRIESATELANAVNQLFLPNQ